MTKKQIRAQAGKYFYDKGMELYRTGGIFEFSADADRFEDGVDGIRAVVRGSGVKTYRVHMDYDFFEDQLLSAYCDCPVFGNSNELCPHCVAVLFRYMEEFGTDAEDEEEEDEYQLSFDFDKEGNVRKKEELRPTSPVITALINRQTKKKMLPVTDKSTFRKVVLKPVLTEFYGEYTLSFMIGINKWYVLKDVFQFADRIRNMEEHTYGKQLKFMHTRDSFAQESVKLVDFLLHLTESRTGESHFGFGYGSYFPVSEGRYITLSGQELEEFLLCMDGEFEAHITGSKAQTWHRQEGFLRKMTLRKEDQGAVLTVEKRNAVTGADYLIYFLDGSVYLESRKKLDQVGDFLENMENVPGGRAYINERDLSAFCSVLLPLLKEIYEIEYDGFDAEIYRALSAEYEIYLDAPRKDVVVCQLKAVYGEEKYDVLSEGSAGREPFHEREGGIRRDFQGESTALATVAEWFPVYDEEHGQMLLSGDEDAMYGLLTDGIPVLQALGTVFISDALKKYRVMETPKIRVGVSVSGELLDLSVASDGLTADQVAEILSKYDRKKKYFRLKNGEFISLGEDSGEIGELSRITKELGIQDAQLKKGRAKLPAYRILYLEEELAAENGLQADRDEYYKARVAEMEYVMKRSFPVPDSLEKIARDYQKAGFEWLMKVTESGFGGILADEMGLGKTLQVIMLILFHFQEKGGEKNKRFLIVTPASLVYNWESEFDRFAPALPVTVVAGDAAQRRAQVLRSAGNEREILITSYDLLRRDIENYEAVDFFLEVIDEAQRIKNHNTQASKAVKAVRAKRKIALTGTPVENRLSELWSIFDYLMPGFLYSYEKFRNKIEIPAVQGENGEVFDRLKRLVHPFILRRLKKDVLKDLPEKIEENLFTKLTEGQRALYDAHEQKIRMMLHKQTKEEFGSSKIQILAELMRLRQLCCDPGLIYENYGDGSAKSEMCMELIENAIEGGHKLLLFSQFTTMLDRLGEILRQRRIPYYVITGAMPKEERAKLVKQFNENEVPVFCISLKAGGTGLNLASADVVIHYDPWWNLAVQNQATDRAHRIGQKNIVTVYKLIARDTIEERIIRLQERKKELADRLLSGGELDTANFSKEDLLELLGEQQST